MTHSSIIPRIAIVTACHNAAQYVGSTIDSVRAQTFPDRQHIVVDDGSTDGSGDVVAALARNDPALTYVTQLQRGCAAARNRGVLSVAPGVEYLLFLDADDCLEPQMLEIMVAYLDTHPEVGLAYSSFSVMDPQGRPLGIEPLQNGWSPRYVPAARGLWARRLRDDVPKTPFVSLFLIPQIIPSVCVFRRSVFQRTPGWDEDMGIIYEDISLYLHVALRAEVHFINHKLVRYRRHPGQSSADLSRFSRNLRQLYEKWNRMGGLTERQQRVVRHARQFREGRLPLFLSVTSGFEQLRRGALRDALLIYAGAVRRYLASFLPGLRREPARKQDWSNVPGASAEAHL